MRYKEFGHQTRLNEDGDLSDYVEDDADHITNDVLANTLREIQFSSDHAQVPKISVEALINLVRNKPGGEAFTLDALEKAKQHNEVVKNIIANIKDDENGTKYVFIKPVDSSVEVPGEEGGKQVQTAPEKTVAGMANRALGKRS